MKTTVALYNQDNLYASLQNLCCVTKYNQSNYITTVLLSYL